MNILAVDTSTPLASVAITTDDTIIAESVFLADRSLSARLVPEIERLLAIAALSAADVHIFAGSVGPGSFTGVRAGIATIQGLALATGRPCAGFSSLTLLAMNFPLAAFPVCALLDARKGEVYAGLFDCSTPIPTSLISDGVMPPESLLDLISTTTDRPVIFAGEGALRYRDLIISTLGEQAILAPYPHHAPHAAHGALLAREAELRGELIEPAGLLPRYIRASEAEYAKLDQQKSLRAK